MRTRGRLLLPLLALFLLLAPAFPQEMPVPPKEQAPVAVPDAAPPGSAGPQHDAPQDPKPKSEHRDEQPAQLRVVLRTGPAPERLRAPDAETPLLLSAVITDERPPTPRTLSPRVEPRSIETVDLVSGLRSLPPPA